MEQVAKLLEPHKETINSTAAIVTCCHFLSGAVLCNDIRKKKSTVGFSVIPFLGGFILTALITRFGMILNDLPTVRINAIGVVLHIVYICFFYSRTKGVKEKTEVWAQLGYGGALLLGIFAYAEYEDKTVLPYRFGIILTVFLVVLVGSPLLSLGEFIRKKTTEGLPFPLILSGTVVSFLWLLHGIVHRENMVILQNGLVFVMNAIQLTLFAIYPAIPAKKTLKKTKSNNNQKKEN